MLAGAGAKVNFCIGELCARGAAVVPVSMAGNRYIFESRERVARTYLKMMVVISVACTSRAFICSCSDNRGPVGLQKRK